jgi:hypothetical protein
MYVAILGDYVELPFGMGADPLIESTFGLGEGEIEFDDEGNPALVFGDGEIYMPMTPVATYTTKVPVCDLLVDAGVAKTNNRNAEFDFYVNGAEGATEVPYTHNGLACEEEYDLDGQGVLTKVYNMKNTGYNGSEFVISQVYYYLAKVTKATSNTHGTNGAYQVEVYVDRDTDEPAIIEKNVTAIGGEFKKGDYVIVHPLGGKFGDNELKAPSKVKIDALAETFTGKITEAKDDPKTALVTYTIGEKVYDLDIDYFYSKAKIDTTAEKPVLPKGAMIWFLDLYGNIIGDMEPAAAADVYVVIDRISYREQGNEDGYALADIVKFDATKEKNTNITDINGEDVENGNNGAAAYPNQLSQQYQQNKDWYKDIYVIDGTSLEKVGDYAEGVDIIKGQSRIDLPQAEEEEDASEEDESEEDVSEEAVSEEAEDASAEDAEDASAEDASAEDASAEDEEEAGPTAIFANKNTLYLVKTGTPWNFTYTSYKGENKVPTMKGVNISYVLDDKGEYAKVIFVDATDATADDAISKVKVIVPPVVGDPVVTVTSKGPIYSYTVYNLDGTETEIKSPTKFTFENTGFVEVTLRNGYYDSDAPLAGYTEIEVADTGYYDGETYVDPELTPQPDFDFIDAAIFIVDEEGIKSGLKPDDAEVVELLTTPGTTFYYLEAETSNQAYTVVYIYPAVAIPQ